MEEITIIIPTRADTEYLINTVNSIRSKEQYDKVKILIGADNPIKETKEWLKNNNEQLNFNYKIYTTTPRIGIVGMVSDLVSKVDTKFVYYMHDDMYIGNYTLKNLINSWKPSYILSSFRVEPPLYAQTPEKLIADLGFTPDEFKKDVFYEIEKRLVTQYNKEAVNGFFAPHFFAVSDWVGYDPVFAPQSREDSDLAQRFIDNNCSLITVKDSVVYHFSGKGSRKKDGVQDSDEWQRSNYKNTRNYIRKWKTLGHTQYIMPLREPLIPISSHTLVGNDTNALMGFLERVEPYMDEMVLVIDTDQPPEVIRINKAIIESFIKKQEALTPTNFDRKKIKVYENSLSNDFAGATNFAVEKCTNEWTIKMDVDEVFPEQFLNNLRSSIINNTSKNPNISVIGFPRLNYLDNKLINDLPRQYWFTEQFDRYEPSEDVQNLDVQFRLHKKSEKWVGKVHEVPESVRNRDYECVVVVDKMYILHPKSREKQYLQEQKYQSIVPPAKEIKNIVYDSVIYTTEGITKHAREEIKELDRRGYNVIVLDSHYKEEFGEYWKKFHKPFDFVNEEYITIVNQPPTRWNNTAFMKNRVGYLAFEGMLPTEWVQIINSSNIVQLWTPSEYNKQIFIKSGVTKPIIVVPHGIDPSVWTKKETSPNKDKTIFLCVGTAHNNRKGFDIMAQAFSEEFSKEENVELVFKINKIYNPEESFNNYIKKYIDWTGNTNITYIDSNLTEEELVSLFKQADVYVSPHRCEGFGINVLNARAIGLPVIATNDSGNKEFCDGIMEIETIPNVWSPLIPPYNRSKWSEPQVESLKKQLRYFHENKEKESSKALNQSDFIRDNWTWEKTVDKILDQLK